MLKKLVSIRNVGPFKDSVAVGNPKLARHTLIVGANGIGKTTLCSVLRSVKSGDPSHITGRKTLGVDEPPTVELSFSDGKKHFDGKAWSAVYPAIAIFDSVFVSENVYSGDVVDIDHTRNLSRVMRAEGVRLAKEDTFLAALSRLNAIELSAAEKAILPHVPMGMDLTEFVDLPPDPDLDARIAEQESIVAAVHQAKEISERPPLAVIEMPAVPEEFAGLRPALLDAKDRASLEAIRLDTLFDVAAEAYELARARAQEIIEASLDLNAVIPAKKAKTEAADVQAAEAELARLNAIKVRHVDPLASLCTDYVRVAAVEKDIAKQKAAVRAQLDEQAGKMMEPFEGLVNEYLDAFNASFRITGTAHGYSGGTAKSNYQMVIDGVAFDLGDAATSPDKPSFKNTLSSGDRTTLALAFFLATLEQDQALADKIVVFDDPCNSQDAFRQRQSVHEITKVAGKCAQVIVLSHDASFLKAIWDKAPPADRVALTLADHLAQGSKIMPVDLEGACQGRTETDIDDLQTYATTGEGKHTDLIGKMRRVLETHCWTTYPASFEPGQDWLGEIVEKIRKDGDKHLAKDLYDELDQIREYTARYHHAEGSSFGTPGQIEPAELTDYIRRTLKVVNSLQA